MCSHRRGVGRVIRTQTLVFIGVIRVGGVDRRARDKLSTRRHEGTERIRRSNTCKKNQTQSPQRSRDAWGVQITAGWRAALRAVSVSRIANTSQRGLFVTCVFDPDPLRRPEGPAHASPVQRELPMTSPLFCGLRVEAFDK